MSLLDLPKVSSETEATLKTADADRNTDFQGLESEQRLQAIKAFSLEGTPSRRKRGWQATVGTLDANPLIKEIMEEGKAIRESERLD